MAAWSIECRLATLPSVCLGWVPVWPSFSHLVANDLPGASAEPLFGGQLPHGCAYQGRDADRPWARCRPSPCTISLKSTCMKPLWLPQLWGCASCEPNRAELGIGQLLPDAQLVRCWPWCVCGCHVSWSQRMANPACFQPAAATPLPDPGQRRGSVSTPLALESRQNNLASQALQGLSAASAVSVVAVAALERATLYVQDPWMSDYPQVLSMHLPPVKSM